MEEKKIKNAIDYIKNSSIYLHDRYSWIIPLVKKTLEDTLCDNDIDDLISSFLTKEQTKIVQKPKVQEAPQAIGNNKNNEPGNNVKRIKSIDNILNIGLLDVSEPIELKDGLNVFYGKNGAGKSSLYLGLCKALCKSKKIYSNVATESEESCSQITVEGGDNSKHVLEWCSSEENEENEEAGVMIFDSQIANWIIEEDQENQFKMTHLKMEYFSFLYDLYQKIEDKIDLKLDNLNTKYDALGQVLVETIPSVFEKEFDWNKEKIKKFDFTEKDEKNLTNYNRQIKILEKDNPESVVRNIKNAFEETESVLSVLGESDEKENKDGNIEYTRELYYDKEYFEEINEQIDKYHKIKKAFEESGKNKISSLIPPEWIDSDKWEEFVSSSIVFLSSLGENESKKYTEETCVYCHQPLQTKEAKALVKAYQELHDEHKEKLDEEVGELKKMSKLMDECVEVVDSISTKNKKIEEECESIGKKECISFDFENIKSIFQEYKTAITKAQKFEIKDVDIKAIEDFWNIYEGLSGKFKIVIDKLNKGIASKGDKIKKLKSKVESLQEKKSLYKSKDGVLEYLKIDDLKEILNKKIADITALKGITSNLKSGFSKEATLKEFGKYLQREYSCFNFVPSEMWNLDTTTRGGINKRVYSIGDRCLADIFSEGEQKLHALSDFFAQCELDKYKGVFIFDDPVNSLDEDNIEVVADRIIELVKNGNQVIVFTHNLYFLNSIINTQKEKITKVEKTNNQIHLLKEINIGETQELKERLKKIDFKMNELADKKPEEINEYDMRNVYDLISGYLEDYVEKVYFKNVISRYRPNIRMHTLGDLKNLDTAVIDNLLKLFEKTSRRGSRHSQPGEVRKPKYEELVLDVKDLKDNYKF